MQAQIQGQHDSSGFPSIAPTPLVSPSNWRRLPKTFGIPGLPEINPENVYAAQESYRGLPPEHIREIWPSLEIKCLGMFSGGLLAEPPQTTLPATYRMALKDVGLATCPTHIFAVFAPDPTTGKNPVERQMHLKREVYVYFFPTNAVIWAAHCARLPRIDSVPIEPEPSATHAAVTVCRLPIVPVQVPCPPKFRAVQLYVYTRDPVQLLRELIVFPRLKKEEYLPLVVAMGEQSAEPLVAALVKHYDVCTILCVARGVWGAYGNLEALGMVDRPAWDAVLFAWTVIMQALERREAQDGPIVDK